MPVESTTGQEKLQKLFDAALRDSSPIEKAPTRVVPESSVRLRSIPKTAETPFMVHAAPKPDTIPQPMTTEPVLDKAAAEELGVLLDDQIPRKKHSHRPEFLMPALVLFLLIGGCAGWFAQSPHGCMPSLRQSPKSVPSTM